MATPHSIREGGGGVGLFYQAPIHREERVRASSGRKVGGGSEVDVVPYLSWFTVPSGIGDRNE